jgi:thiamine phosphate synthase YjbQ (UPF0047 family)
MSVQPREILLHITPQTRFDMIDVVARVREQHRDVFADYRKTLCCSFHTTAGYLDQQFCAALGYSEKRLRQFLLIFQRVFPPNAGYYHDCMRLRTELSESAKAHEPANADSHLTFMSAGLQNCVTYTNTSNWPIYFIELDGIYKHYHRTRRTTLLVYNKEVAAYRGRFAIPTQTAHSIDAFNLRDPQYGLFTHLHTLIERYSIEQGRIDIRLAPDEHHVGLTVNEYEPMLMRNDFPEVLRDPLRYMVQYSKELLRNPAAIPAKMRDYTISDLIHLYNEVMDNVQIGRSLIDRGLSFLSGPASRLFRLKRDISLFISGSVEAGRERIMQGTYQSPILIQSQQAEKGVRCLEVTLWAFR